MEGFDEFDGPLDGGDGVVQGGPGFFVVGIDGGPIFSKGVADADEGLHVAVGDVVDELADGPAAVAVGGVELCVVEVVGGVAEVFGHACEGVDGFCALLGGDGFRAREFADGILGVGVGGEAGGVLFRLSHAAKLAHLASGWRGDVSYEA